MLKRVWLIVGWLLIILIVYLSLAPNPPTLVMFENADKVEHAFAYATVAFWLCAIYLTVRSRVVVIVALIGLGVALEYVQDWTGYRSFDVMDMLADTVGVLLGWLVARTRLGRLFAYIERLLAR